MVRRWSVLPRENGISKILTAAPVAGAVMFRPTGLPSDSEGLLAIQPPAMRRRSAPIGVVGQPAAGPGILAPGVAMRCGQRLRNFGARAETGIDQALLFQCFEGFSVGGGAVRLDDCLAVVTEAEPGKIFENPIDELGPAAAGIKILDPEQEFAAAVTGP